MRNLRWAAAGTLAVFIVATALSLPPAGSQEPPPAETKSAAIVSPTELDARLIEAGKTNSEVMANLTYLSDVIGPRLTGSANLKKANEWAAARMTSYGLTNVSMEAWELPVGWERGTASARLIEPDNGRSITVAAMAWTPGTSGKVVGDVVVVNAKTPEELKQYEGKLKNAIVLRGAPAEIESMTKFLARPMFGGPAAEKGQKAANTAGDRGEQPKAEVSAARPGRDGGFNTRSFGEGMRFRREMAEFLRKEGVAVMLTDAGKPHGLLTMTGGWRGQDRVSAPDPLPTLFVTHDHYALLHRLASRPTPAVTRMEVEITNKFVPGPLAVYNTVGEIRGSEKSDEFVVIGAHIDSWDLAQGTTDNGTGTCVVLEAARILAKSGVAPKRTIRFALFSGEEQGLHGSKAFVARHKADMPKTTAAIVHDTGTGRVKGISLMGREVLKPIIEEELAALKELGVTEITTQSMGGSDHQSFEGAGVPGFMFRQDPAEYRLTHHSQSDTLDKAREPDLVQGAQVMAVAAMRLANRSEMLPRDKPEPPRREGAKAKDN